MNENIRRIVFRMREEGFSGIEIRRGLREHCGFSESKARHWYGKLFPRRERAVQEQQGVGETDTHIDWGSSDKEFLESMLKVNDNVARATRDLAFQKGHVFGLLLATSDAALAYGKFLEDKRGTTKRVRSLRTVDLSAPTGSAKRAKLLGGYAKARAFGRKRD